MIVVDTGYLDVEECGDDEIRIVPTAKGRALRDGGML